MNLCVVTGSRAEYGILSNLMRRLRDSQDVNLQIIATNMHLEPKYGMTVNEIINDGFTIDYRVEMMVPGDSPESVVKSMGRELTGLADAFAELKPDMLLILGDRYEMLMAASAALIFGIPIAHLHGGEMTEGAIDDSIRHAITKLSTLHFTATEEYRQRVIQMGEDPQRVFNAGSLAVDGITRFSALPLTDLEASIQAKLGEGFLLVTFHPVTRQPGEERAQTEALLRSLDRFPTKKILFTMPNSDSGGECVASMIEKWVAQNSDRSVLVKSLGRVRYYSALKYCGAVVGNSSSGLIEAPSFGVPTVNIGDRQKGRSKGNTVIDCDPEEESIVKAISKVLTPEFACFCKEKGYNPYHKPGTEKFIYRELLEFFGRIK